MHLPRWARWLITWQLELTDGKTRPRGSPPRDASLASLAACRSAAFAAAGAGGGVAPAGTPKNPAAVAAAAAAQAVPGRAAVAEAAAPVCTFPEHHPDCRCGGAAYSDTHRLLTSCKQCLRDGWRHSETCLLPAACLGDALQWTSYACLCGRAVHTSKLGMCLWGFITPHINMLVSGVAHCPKSAHAFGRLSVPARAMCTAHLVHCKPCADTSAATWV